MNEGLLSNHTVMGIHMLGNALDTDANGFITIDTDKKPSSDFFLTRMDP